MTLPITPLLRPAWLSCATAAAAVALALLTACGGGGGDSAGPPDPPATVPLGDPVTKTVGAAGGSVAFTASGVAGSLTIPAGALAADTAVTVTPVAPGAEEWARVDVTGIDTVLEQPATLTLTLPAGSALDAAAAVTQLGTDGDVLLPARVDTAARQVSVPVQRFSVGARTVEQVGERKQARAALPGDPASTLILNQRLLVRLRVITAEARYQQLVSAKDYSSTLELSMSIAALLQASGLDGYAADALPWLQRAQTGACENLRGAIERAQSEPAPTELDLEGRIANAYVTRLSAPVLYWSSVADRLGGSCPNLNPSAALSGVHQRVLGVIGDKLVQRQDVATLRGAVGEAAAAAALKRQADTLAATQVGPRSSDDRSRALDATPAPQGSRGLLDAATNPATLGAQIRDEVTTPALTPIRAGMWTGAMASGTSAEYGRPLQVYGAASPLADDVQQIGTTLQVGSYSGAAATQVEGQAAMGRKATPESSIKAWTVSAKSGGKVSLDGPIQVLKCPLPANESLVVEFEGAEILNQASSGDLLLGTLSFETDRLLNAAGIQPADATQHVLRLWRKGSGCNTVFGLGDATVAEITLDFSKTCRAAPGTTHCVTVVNGDNGAPLVGWQLVDGAEDGTLLLRSTTPPAGGLGLYAQTALWKAGRLTRLPADFWGTAVSSSGSVVGLRWAPVFFDTEEGAPDRWAAFWRAGVVTTVGPKTSMFNDVNDSDLMVGDYRQLVNNGTAVYFPGMRSNGGAAPELDSNRNSTLRAVNNAGVVCMDNAVLYAPQLPQCSWINDHGRSDTSTGRARLIMNTGAERTGFNWQRAGPRHAIAVAAGVVSFIDMATNEELPVPVLDPVGRVRQDELPLEPLTRAQVDLRGRVAVELSGGRLAILTPNGVDKR